MLKFKLFSQNIRPFRPFALSLSMSLSLSDSYIYFIVLNARMLEDVNEWLASIDLKKYGIDAESKRNA